ncbi:Nramp family divalent metal transporter [Anatilimnocola sp. NA78]|uniref:Nramp family divalent metal transporter n=1 Tax=Anatilimnocola sp. NA78 TaxID=3415683 RepID=UPI003CE517AB
MSAEKKPAAELAPWPGSHAMPRWSVDELSDAPTFQWKNALAMVGPGLVMGAAAIGGGEWLAGPAVTAKYGGALLWIGTVSILFQVIYNIEISRYTLYCGEPIFSGKFRIPPHPMFWVLIYFMLDWGSIAPYLAVNAAIPLEAIFLQRLPDPDNIPRDWWVHKFVATGLYLLVLIPLIFGGKIYNSLKVVMSFKLFAVITFLLFLGIFFSRPATWGEIFSGLFQIGTVPVLRGEDLNGNGILDPGEDFDQDGRLDVNEGLPPSKEKGAPTWKDQDGDGKRDGYATENIFVYLWNNGSFPTLNLSLIATLGSLAAIAGNGGLTNAPISNFTRDQGWGMGAKVGAIPSVIGGHGISLSHEGSVFIVNEESMPRWRRWYRHILRDQLLVWMGACLIGVSLPSILSVEFLPRGTEASSWTGAAMTAGGVQQRVSEPVSGTLAYMPALRSMISGPNFGRFFWGATLFCGFLVMITSHTTTTDGFVRRWVDVFWTASPQLRKLPGTAVKYVYFIVLCICAVCGLTILWLMDKPGRVFEMSTTFYNFAFAFSSWHTLIVNTTLLPKQLRPNWFVRIGLVLSGIYFSALGVLMSMKFFGYIA